MRVLVRAGKYPWEALSATETLAVGGMMGNTGNLMFSTASIKFLLAGGADPVPTRRSAAGPEDADRVNDEFDMMVLPLANVFRLQFRRQLQNLTALIERLRIPVVVVSAGAQSDLSMDRDRLEPLDDLVRAFMSAVLERSASVGVRGEFTADYLATLGFTDVEVIGCPSMFMEGDRTRVTKRVDALDRRSLFAMNGHHQAQQLAPIIRANGRRYPRMLFIAQIEREMRSLLGEEPTETDGDLGLKARNPAHPAHRLYREGRVRYFLDPDPWISFLGGCDLAFGARIHGNIAAILAGIPACVFAHDSRTTELAHYLGIPYRSLQDVDPRLDAADLYESLDFTAFNEGHPARFRRFTEFLTRNGVPHGFDVESGAAFDARVRAAGLPGPVVPATSP